MNRPPGKARLRRGGARRATRRVGEERGRVLSRAPAGAGAGVPDAGRAAGEARLHAGRCRRHTAGRHRPARPVSVHARALPDHVPRALLDDAPDRGLRHRGRHQRALQVPDRAGADRALRWTSTCRPDGLRLRRPASLGEVGREGVAIDTLADMEALFDGIDLERISVSMTINPTAWILLAMYVALAEKRGYDLDKLSGTDPGRHPEGVPRAEGVDLPDPRRRCASCATCIVWCARNMPRYNPINISGYHISEAGATAAARGWPSRWRTRSPTWRR